ncbi:MAG TPA: hypothetical protein VFW83_06065 [Bryobacteraceae bacterium]|nr:hypothetical protein [Bryobacteraceae bacterium]
MKNGELLREAEAANIDVFVTGDRGMQYQQNIDGRKIAVVWLSANNWPLVRNHLSCIAGAIARAPAGSFTRVDCGVFTRGGAKLQAANIDD